MTHVGTRLRRPTPIPKPQTPKSSREFCMRSTVRGSPDSARPLAEGRLTNQPPTPVADHLPPPQNRMSFVRAKKIAAHVGHLVAQTLIWQGLQQAVPPSNLDPFQHLVVSNSLRDGLPTSHPHPDRGSPNWPIAFNPLLNPRIPESENRNARCAPTGKAGQPITKPLFCRHLEWLARSCKLDDLANQSKSERGSGVPILKFEGSTQF